MTKVVYTISMNINKNIFGKPTVRWRHKAIGTLLIEKSASCEFNTCNIRTCVEFVFVFKKRKILVKLTEQIYGIVLNKSKIIIKRVK